MDNTIKPSAKVEEGFLGQSMIVIPPDIAVRIAMNKLSGSLYPTAIGYYPHASYHDRERTTGSEQYILLYCVDGKGWIESAGKTHVLTANTFFILPPGIAHHYGSSNDEPWSIYWVHFTGKQAGLLYSTYARSGIETKNIAYDEQRQRYFHIVFNAAERDFSKLDSERMYISLLNYISSFVYSTDDLVVNEHDPISESIGYMKQNLNKTLSLADLAHQVNYSTSRYSELFRAKTGYSPVQYFIRLRIQKSCQYLYFSRMTLKEICLEIGFEDPFYFSRLFKQQLGLSPMKYRQSHRKA